MKCCQVIGCMNISKKKSASDIRCVCLLPHDGNDDDDVDAAADSDRTRLQDTVLQINFNRVDHPQVQSCDYPILNSFTEQTLLHGKQETFFSPCVINQQCANKRSTICEKKIN